MKDDRLLSLHLDGRLAPREAARLERRMRSEPELRDRFRALQRLQASSERLRPTAAEFTADQVRARPATPTPPRPWRRAAAAAAAVIALALTHGVAYRLGAERVPGRLAAGGAASPLDEAEALVSRAAGLDAALPPEELRTQLVALRERVEPLTPQLATFAVEQLEEPQQERAARLIRAVDQMELAFESVDDPGFLGIALKAIARGSLDGSGELRFVPATAQVYTHTAPLGGDRFRVMIVRTVDGVPQVLRDEGTVEELRQRLEGVEFVAKER